MAAPTVKFLCTRFTRNFLLRFKERNCIKQIVNQSRRTVCVISQQYGKRTGCLTSGFVAISLFGFGFLKEKEKEKPVEPEDEMKKVIRTADELYEKNEQVKLYELLLRADNNNAEILWRLARATRDKGQVTTDKTEKKKLMLEAFDLVEKALELDENNFECHKWYATLLDLKGEYIGAKFRLSNTYEVKNHFLRAMELNPKDGISIYAVGYWCYAFADLPWYMRTIASALFATPPTSTFEEALYYFEKAEAAVPNFYSMNLLMLGKTHLRLGNNDKARMYLRKAHKYPIKTEDDEQAHKESESLLKKLGD